MSTSVLRGLLLFGLTQTCSSLKLLTDSGNDWNDEATEEVGGGKIVRLTTCGKRKEVAYRLAPPGGAIGQTDGKGAKCQGDAPTKSMLSMFVDKYVLNLTTIQYTEPWEKEKKRTPTTCNDGCITAWFLKKAIMLPITSSRIDGLMFAKSGDTMVKSRGLIVPDPQYDADAALQARPATAGGLFYSVQCDAAKVNAAGYDDSTDGKKIVAGWSTYSCGLNNCLANAANVNALSVADAGLSAKYGKPLYSKCLAKGEPDPVLSCYIGICASVYAFFGKKCGTVSTEGNKLPGTFYGVNAASVSLSPAAVGDVKLGSVTSHNLVIIVPLCKALVKCGTQQNFWPKAKAENSLRRHKHDLLT